MKYIITRLPLIFLFFFSFIGEAQVQSPDPQNTVRFTENKNQWESQVLYRAQLDGGALFLEKNCFTYNFYDKETLRNQHYGQSENDDHKHLKLRRSGPQEPIERSPIRSHAFRMTFLNASANVLTSAKQMTPDYCNYYIGNDKRKWASDVKNYKEVNYKNIYSGIDLQILGLENSMKYNFFVAPNANPDEIQLSYTGLTKIKINHGSLIMITTLNKLVEQRPFAYQVIDGEQIEVSCEFILENTTVTFSFPEGYNKNIELVIDPVLLFAASSGSLADNFGMTATYDADGNLYSGGTVFNQGYPTTVGVYDSTFNGATAYGRTDIAITKYDSSGTFLLYSTYLGGAISTEIVTSLVVDNQNELLLYGATGSPDFPVTADAYDRTFNGGDLLRFICNGTYFDNGTDIYVSKFNSTGTSLLASTFIGGSSNDGVNTNNQTVSTTACSSTPTFEYPLDSLQYNYGDQFRGEINVDPFGNVCIASSSRSSDFPTINSFDNTLGGIQDAVVFKLSNNLSQLMWSTYLGGADNDAGYALALDDSSNIYVTGGTRSFDFPTTAGALQTSYNGGEADGYITKIKHDGSAILFSTYWGTNAYDQNYFVQLDKSNDVYVVGQTEGAMPITVGVYNDPNSGQFITKINDSLNTLIYSTVFGNGNGMPNISPSAFLIDNCENIYVSGWGGNIMTGQPTLNMPLSADAYQPTTDGFNFYLFVLTTDAATLKYATYFGGGQSWEHVDGGTSRFDKKGIVYQSVCAGCGGNDDFPVTPGAWPNTGANVNHASNCNNGVFKFDFDFPLTNADFTVDYQNSCGSQTVQFFNKNYQNTSYLWDFGGGDTTSTVLNPIRVFPTPGTFLVKLSAYNPSNCTSDSVYNYVTVFPYPTMTLANPDTTICGDETVAVKLTSDVAATYTWIASDNPNVTGESTSPQETDSITDFLQNTSTVAQVVSYTITPQAIGSLCMGTPITYTVNVLPLPNLVLGTDTTICDSTALSVPLASDIASTYTWIASDNLNVLGESATLQNTDTINDVLNNSSTAMQIVTYTVTPISSPGGCSGPSETYTATIVPTPILSNSIDTTICNKVPLTIPFNSNLSSSFTWLATNNSNVSGESTAMQNTNTLTDVLQNNSSLTQVVTYTITTVSDVQNCVGPPVIMTVNVNPSPVIAPIPDTTICGDTLAIVFITDIASNYTWIASDNPIVNGESTTLQISDTINDQLQNYSIATQVVTYAVTPTSLLGCSDTSISFNVNIKSSPVVTNNTNIAICNNAILNEPLGSSVPSLFTWIASDNPNVLGESLTIQNTNTISDALQNSTTVTQIVTYTISPRSIGGSCDGPDFILTVDVIPSPTIIMNPDTTICNKDELEIALVGNIPSDFTWIASDNSNVTGESLSIQTTDTLTDILQNNAAGIELVIYTITPTSTTANCVGTSFTYSVTVMPEIDARFNFTHNACIYEATFMDASINLPVKWLWDLGDGNTDTLQNPLPHVYNSEGNYSVMLTVYDNNDCQDTVTMPVAFSDPIVAVSQEKSICLNDQIQLSASGGVAYDWSPTAGLSQSNIYNPVASPITTTTYSVDITTVSPLGDSCSKVLSTTINVIDPVLFTVSATVDKDTIFKGESTTIHALLSDKTLSITWQSSTKESLPNTKDVIVFPVVSTTYTASILDGVSCAKSGSVEVFVIACDPATVFVPNTFTPNGDGKNDVLYVRGNEITDLYFAVYNRWGELVFETTDIKNGWNGIYKNMNSDPVVFAWYLKAKCYDGFGFEKKGNVTLIR